MTSNEYCATHQDAVVKTSDKPSDKVDEEDTKKPLAEKVVPATETVLKKRPPIQLRNTARFDNGQVKRIWHPETNLILDDTGIFVIGAIKNEKFTTELTPVDLANAKDWGFSVKVVQASSEKPVPLPVKVSTAPTQKEVSKLSLKSVEKIVETITSKDEDASSYTAEEEGKDFSELEEEVEEELEEEEEEEY